ncbi:MAG: YtxH domain-containing protein [Lachnospiraceae bacterium]|nr:YtxH domain-containing protein [Lachnospiraceae bacterium]
MAKGFGKFVAFCTVVGAAAAGAYYYMNRRDKALADDFDDDFDDFGDFDDADDEDAGKENRKYVSIDHPADDAADKDAATDEADKDAAETEDFFDDTDA